VRQAVFANEEDAVVRRDSGRTRRQRGRRGAMVAEEDDSGKDANEENGEIVAKRTTWSGKRPRSELPSPTRNLTRGGTA